MSSSGRSISSNHHHRHQHSRHNHPPLPQQQPPSSATPNTTPSYPDHTTSDPSPPNLRHKTTDAVATAATQEDSLRQSILPQRPFVADHQIGTILRWEEETQSPSQDHSNRPRSTRRMSFIGVASSTPSLSSIISATSSITAMSVSSSPPISTDGRPSDTERRQTEPVVVPRSTPSCPDQRDDDDLVSVVGSIESGRGTRPAGLRGSTRQRTMSLYEMHRPNVSHLF